MSVRKRRLLVVDDEPALQKLVGRHAERGGFDVVVASTAAEAVELAGTASPDAILLDLTLPDGSGIDVLARLKGNPSTARIPVVVWSGSDVDEGSKKAFEAGAIGYFDKTELKELITKLTQLLHG
jgi:CheY-like chemotaxis protein